jgi:polyisoprenoid-binding protein YceI
MRTILTSLVAFYILLGTSAAALAASQQEPAATHSSGKAETIFASGEHCVAYRTIKGMFVWFEATVLGRNCSFDARLEAFGPDYRLVMTIPVTSFESGNETRDEHVAELLGGPSRRALEFQSEPLSGTRLAALLQGQPGTVAGDLFIGGRPHGVVFEVQLHRQDGRNYLDVHLQTTFSALGITVPKVGPGGLIARPGDAVELLAQLDPARLAAAKVLEEWSTAQATALPWATLSIGR